MEQTFILASGSPRRRELLSLITTDFTCMIPDTDEVSGVSAENTARLCAEAKCRAVKKIHPDSIVMGCDTVVEAGGMILGKPKSDDEARNMLRLLSGKRHAVYTGVHIQANEREIDFCTRTEVVFSEIPQMDIEGYIKTEEPYDKAGGYGIQGWAAKYITEIHGDFFNVMGLPVSAVFRALRELGTL